MPDQPPPTPSTAKSRMRSPAYPFFGLGEAITKASLIWDSLRKNDGHLDSVIHAMGFGSANGASLRAIGALNHYGLTEETGAKGNRRIRLSELALDILHLPEGDEKRDAALKAAALAPAIHQALWDRYQQTLPKDDVIKGFLVRDRAFSPEAAADVIQNYRDSFYLAKLAELSEAKPQDAADQLRPENAARLPQGTAKPQFTSLLAPRHAPIPPQTVTPMIPIPIGPGLIASIPMGIEESSFQMLLDALKLYKPMIVAAPASGGYRAEEPQEPEEGWPEGMLD